jgi:multisubunit Na+/H+ antiporter MnhB subunit
MVDINLLLIIMVVGAIVAVETRDLLSCIVSIGLVGLAQSLGFLVLKAPDLAIVQLVVEILSLVILLRATIHRGVLGSPERRDRFPTFVALALCAIILAAAYPVLHALPAFGDPLMNVSRNYIEKGVTGTGAANLVSSVVLDYRAYDTLGEAVVLFTAVIGALAVLRTVGRKGAGQKGSRK